MFNRLTPAALLIVFLAGCATGPQPGGVWGEPENGRHIVRQHCAGCHNVQPSGVSVYREAPPFRTLGARYDGFSLRENVARISGAPHYGMPQIILSPRDAWDIAAYINAFAAADPRRRRKMAVAPCIGVAC